MSRQSLAALRQTLTVQWPSECKETGRRLLIDTAKKVNLEILQEQKARAGIAPLVTSYANHPGNSNLETVQVPGPIVHNYDYRPEIVLFALGALEKASPIVSGAYLANHTVFLNGLQVERLDRLEDGDEVWISNPVPYARRLEIGKTKSKRDFVLQVPNRIYETVAKKVLIPRYRGFADIEFAYVTLPDSVTIKGKLSSHYGTGRAAGIRGGGVMRKRRQKVGEKVRAPAIIIKAFR